MTQHTLFGFPVGGGGKKAGSTPPPAGRPRSLFGFAFGPVPKPPAAAKKPTRKQSTTRTLPDGVDAAHDDAGRGRRSTSRR